MKVDSLRIIVEAIGGERLESGLVEKKTITVEESTSDTSSSSDVFSHPLLASQNTLLESLKIENTNLRRKLTEKDKELIEITALENQIEKMKKRLKEIKGSHGRERERVEGLEESLGRFESR